MFQGIYFEKRYCVTNTPMLRVMTWQLMTCISVSKEINKWYVSSETLFIEWVLRAEIPLTFFFFKQTTLMQKWENAARY